MRISVLISTYGDRVENLAAVLRDPQIDVQYFVCHQGVAAESSSSFLAGRDDVVYMKSATRGVTKSRNLLIERALEEPADILYFCDDDVTLVADFADKLRAGFTRLDAEVLTFEVNNEHGQRRKSYPQAEALRNKNNILSVGTVEIALRASAVGPRRFPEDLGAGAALPVGDEAVFLAHFLNAGLRVQHVNAVLCSHPDESSGATAGLAFNESRGVTIRRVYGGAKGFLILFYFIILRRQLIFSSAKFSHVAAVRSLFKGFFRA